MGDKESCVDDSMDIYEKLVKHLSAMGMGYPVRKELYPILKETFTKEEAEVALAIPNTPVPLQFVEVDEIRKSSSLDREELLRRLEDLASKRLIARGPTQKGEVGYALHQFGYGFPQTFFWEGKKTPEAIKMASLLGPYYSSRITEEAHGTATKAYRYVPVRRSLEIKKQAVLPVHTMEFIVEQAKAIAVAHCPCRMIYSLQGRKCDHPLEVCLKFNSLAAYIIDRGIGREVTKEEALQIIRKSEEAGLVHFVDNAEEEVLHNCNCCGCACWSVGNIRRKRIPRDVLMATYFIRETDEEACTGCGACVDICPVSAVTLEEDIPKIQKEWCIGCGVCETVCPSDAAFLVPRPDRTGLLPAKRFEELHRRIRKDRGLATC